MVTIICATNRPQNQTLKVVELYESLLSELGQEVRVFRMDELPENFVVSDTYGERSEAVLNLLQTKLIPAEKLVIIAPEYNGSYPGILKLFFDGIEPRLWKGKKTALVGVATGRAGNQRGMDHLTHVLHHLKMEVYSKKVPISKLNDLLDSEGNINDKETLMVLREQALGLLEF